ncbi:MAG: hypothetical protein K2M19_02800 [Muribaculaceae bacterium]|nr:hypothetical protein [Muribaculaceae bacterium]
MNLRLLSFIFFILSLVGLSGCIEDGFSDSGSDQPEFSVDTLKMGVILTEQPSTTSRFVVYNRAKKGMQISNVSLSGPHASLFRLNVDGFSGTEFRNVEIRANDSIFIFVEATLPANERDVPVYVDASLDFVTNGVHRSVTIAAQGRDVRRLRGVTIDTDTRFEAGKPYQVFDSLVVAPGATLTVDPGVEFMFHDGAMMVVRGTLKAVGTPGNEITFAGDRTGNVAGDISFDIMSRQWTGMFFTPTSTDSELSYAHVCNTWQGVTVTGAPLRMVNTRLRNSGGSVLEAYDARIEAIGCEMAEAAESPVVLSGGSHYFEHCTLANYYLFVAPAVPIVTFDHFNELTDNGSGAPYLQAQFLNTIIYGLGTDLSHGEFTGLPISLESCLLKSAGTDDDNFIRCIWDTDPLYNTVRDEYIFDYTLKPESPAIGAATAPTSPAAATDRLGNPRYGTIGAYEYQER